MVGPPRFVVIVAPGLPSVWLAHHRPMIQWRFNDDAMAIQYWVNGDSMVVQVRFIDGPMMGRDDMI